MRILLATSLLMACGLAAQTPAVRASLATADVVGVNANRQTDLARGGQAIDPALGLRVNDGREVLASSLAAVVNETRGTGARFAWSARATSGNTAGTLGAASPNSASHSPCA